MENEVTDIANAKSSRPKSWADDLLSPKGISALILTPLCLWVGTTLVTWIPPQGEGMALSRYLATIIFFLFMAFGMYLIKLLRPINRVDLPSSEPERSKTLFSRHFLVIGFILFMLSITAMIAISGLVRCGVLRVPLAASAKTSVLSEQKPTQPTSQIKEPEKAKDADEAGKGCPVQVICNEARAAYYLAVSLLMSIIGAFFFVAYSLCDGKNPGVNAEPKDIYIKIFDENVFWGGVWFRMGESAVFCIVVFLFTTSNLIPETPGTSPSALFQGLPVISLLMGMFIKSGERLIFGMAEKVFEGISSMFTQAREQSPDNPRNLRVNQQPGRNPELTWEEPVSGGRPTTYRVIRVENPDDPKPKETVVETSFLDRRTEISPPPSGDFFYFHVVARNGGGESGPSNIVKVG